MKNLLKKAAEWFKSKDVTTSEEGIVFIRELQANTGSRAINVLVTPAIGCMHISVNDSFLPNPQQTQKQWVNFPFFIESLQKSLEERGYEVTIRRESLSKYLNAAEIEILTKVQ